MILDRFKRKGKLAIATDTLEVVLTNNALREQLERNARM